MWYISYDGDDKIHIFYGRSDVHHIYITIEIIQTKYTHIFCNRNDMHIFYNRNNINIIYVSYMCFTVEISHMWYLFYNWNDICIFLRHGPYMYFTIKMIYVYILQFEWRTYFTIRITHIFYNSNDVYILQQKQYVWQSGRYIYYIKYVCILFRL